MRVDIKVPFKCEPLNAIQDVKITLAIRLSISGNKEEITRRIFRDKYPDVDWDTVDFNNLEQDELCKNNIIGYKRIGKQNYKHYFVKCDICSEKSELNGLGYSIVSKSNMTKGVVSCSCSKIPSWTQYQHTVRVQEYCNNNMIFFCGFEGLTIGNKTKLRLKCSEKTHPIWKSTVIGNLLQRNVGCPVCKGEQCKIRLTIDDELHINDFFNTGSFHKDTIFCHENNNYFTYKCSKCSTDEYTLNGVCSGIFSSYMGDLKKGIRSCRCSKSYNYTKEQYEYRIKKELKVRPSLYKFIGFYDDNISSDGKIIMDCKNHGQFYPTIHCFIDGKTGCPQCAGQNQLFSYISICYKNDIPIAIKYGIETVIKKRLYAQNYNSSMTIKRHKTYKFTSTKNCKCAEKECIELFQNENLKNIGKRGVVLREDMMDGYTETTTIDNINIIHEIYTKWGGVIV